MRRERLVVSFKKVFSCFFKEFSSCKDFWGFLTRREKMSFLFCQRDRFPLMLISLASLSKMSSPWWTLFVVELSVQSCTLILARSSSGWKGFTRWSFAPASRREIFCFTSSTAEMTTTGEEAFSRNHARNSSPCSPVTSDLIALDHILFLCRIV